MNMNPEFLRNFWLEMTMHRRLMMPVVLLFIFFITHSIGEWALVHNVSLLIYVVLTMLWGARLTGETLIDEIDNRTWDQQRMSAIMPWQMSWGKLFGSTVYVWYGALFTLPFFLLSGVITSVPMLWLKLLLLLSGAVLIQALALHISLLMIRRNGRHRRSLSNIALIAALIFITMAAPFYDEYYARLNWYGLAMSQLVFLTLSSLLFCGWALLGLYRTMGEELQLKNRPIIWFAFTLFLIIYVMGLSPLNSGDGLELNIAGAFFIALALCYLMIFIERKEPLDLRRFWVTKQGQGFYAALTYLPCWLVSLLMVVLLGLILQFVNGAPMRFLDISQSFDKWVLLSLLFLLRDIGIVIYFNLTKNSQRADVTALVYLILLYLLLPMLLSAVGLVSVNNLLVPTITTSAGITLIAGIVQCGVVGWLIYRRWVMAYRY